MAFLQLETLWVSEQADGVAAIVLDASGSEINCLGRRFLDDLNAALDRIAEANRFRHVLIRSNKEQHFAEGPDLDELSRLAGPEEFADYSRRGQAVLRKLQTLPIPSIAWIRGSCLGTGLELALACDYRFVSAGIHSRLGFASSDLGLLPAWGGTQRLPRLVGLERSLFMLMRDRQASATTAVEWGLADALLAPNEDPPARLIDNAQKQSLKFLPLRTWRQWFFERFRWGRWLITNGMKELLKRRVPDDLPAPWEMLAVVRRGVEEGAEAGLDHERAAFTKLSQSNAFRNLLRLKRAVLQIQANHAAALPSMNASLNPCTIGVIGAGARGVQLACLAVTRGCRVVVREVNDTALGRAMYQLFALLAPLVQVGAMKVEDFQEKLTGTSAWKGFADADFIFETTGADVASRLALFRDMEKEARPDALLATTSDEPVLDELRTGLSQPQRVSRVHFVLPLKRGALVEIVGPPRVDQSVADRLSLFALQLGCVPVLVQDWPGLIVERILLAGLQEALDLLLEGIPLKRIDEALRRFGMLGGPFEQADLTGLDRLDRLAAQLEKLFPERFLQDELLAQMIDKGWLGQKTRLGFYEYARRTPRSNPHLLPLVRELIGAGSSQEFPLSSKDQMDRCRQRIVLRTVNEAAWCLEEGVMDNAMSLDLALSLAGWAPHRGGPLTYAQIQGPAEIITSLEALAHEHGPRFLPCPALRTLSADTPRDLASRERKQAE